jgi:hypothetical protein
MILMFGPTLVEHVLLPIIYLPYNLFSRENAYFVLQERGMPVKSSHISLLLTSYLLTLARPRHPPEINPHPYLPRHTPISPQLHYSQPQCRTASRRCAPQYPAIPRSVVLYVCVPNLARKMPLLATQRDSPHLRPGVVGQIWRPGDSLAAGKDDRHEVRAWQCRTASWVKSSLGVVRARLSALS